MTKIVINACYGGFSISSEALARYLAIKGIIGYPLPEEGHISLVPPDQRENQDNFYELSMEERAASNARYKSQTLSRYDIPRDDPTLIQVVEELSGAANGGCSSLKVVEIPDDVSSNWEIAEYDGMEWVAEKHRTWS